MTKRRSASCTVSEVVGSSRMMIRRPPDGLGNLDQLPLSGREVLNQRVRVRGQVYGIQQAPGLRPHRPLVDERHAQDASPGHRPEAQVLGDAEVAEKVQFLMDEGDSPLGRLRRITRGVGLALQQHPARIGGQDAPKDVHQRRLARAVLADQTADFPRARLRLTSRSTRTPKKALWTPSKRRIVSVMSGRTRSAGMRRRATSMRAAKRMTEPFAIRPKGTLSIERALPSSVRKMTAKKPPHDLAATTGQAGATDDDRSDDVQQEGLTQRGPALVHARRIDDEAIARRSR